MTCAMNKGKTIFSQIMSLIPERDFKFHRLNAENEEVLVGRAQLHIPLTLMREVKVLES